MPIRVFNWDRQQKLLDPNAAMQAGAKAKIGPENGANAIIKVLDFLNDYSLQWRIQREFNDLVPSARDEIVAWSNLNETGRCYDPKDAGIVMRLITATGSAPISMKAPRSFVALMTGDAGLDPLHVFQKYVYKPIVYPSPPPNMTLSFSFLWYKYD